LHLAGSAARLVLGLASGGQHLAGLGGFGPAGELPEVASR
jgi:hypothetical protein